MSISDRRVVTNHEGATGPSQLGTGDDSPQIEIIRHKSLPSHSHPRVDSLCMETTPILPGTLDLLLLKALSLEPMHGYGIALRLRQISGDVFRVEEGTLYPALQRLLAKSWVAAEWKQTENNRRARYYRLTPAGRKQLQTQRAEFNKVLGAIVRVMDAT